MVGCMEYSGLGTQVLKMCSCGGEACSCWAEEQHSPWAVAGEVRPPAAAAAVSGGVEVPCGVCICVGQRGWVTLLSYVNGGCAERCCAEASCEKKPRGSVRVLLWPQLEAWPKPEGMGACLCFWPVWQSASVLWAGQEKVLKLQVFRRKSLIFFFWKVTKYFQTLNWDFFEKVYSGSGNVLLELTDNSWNECL